MSLTEQQQLIFDTLHYRPPDDRGHCGYHNEPGVKLIESDASYLPAVEATLLQHAQVDDGWRVSELDHVIGAFLILSIKYSPDTLVSFIRSLPPAFMKEVVVTIPTWFRKVKPSGTYNFTVAPPRDLIELVRELARGEDPRLKKAAQRTLEFLKEDLLR